MTEQAPLLSIIATKRGVSEVGLGYMDPDVDGLKLHAALLPVIRDLDAAIRSARGEDSDSEECARVENLNEALLCLTAATEWFERHGAIFDPVIDLIGTAHVQAARIHEGLTV